VLGPALRAGRRRQPASPGGALAVVACDLGPGRALSRTDTWPWPPLPFGRRQPPNRHAATPDGAPQEAGRPASPGPQSRGMADQITGPGADSSRITSPWGTRPLADSVAVNWVRTGTGGTQDRHSASGRCHQWLGEDAPMAMSHYKGAWIGKTPMCAICAGPGEGERAQHHLTHGVSVWLCEVHRSVEFQRRRGGRDFVASLAAVWNAAGVATRRHDRALRAHLTRVRPGDTGRPRPGSYAWAELRREAERRFGQGENPALVVAELARARTVGASGPTYRTLQRWFSDGRWLPVASVPRRAPPGTASTKRPGTPPTATPTGRLDARGDNRSSSPIRGPC